MLTFEKVLKVLQPQINRDICEVLLTSRGYVVMEWDGYDRSWYNVTHCDTPQALRDAMLRAYQGYLQVNDGFYELTIEGLIEQKLAYLRRLCDGYDNAEG